jgi:hypothetical protein
VSEGEQRCLVCGEHPDDHHEFVAPPAGCKCEPMAWFSADVPAVCLTFVDGAAVKTIGAGLCATCSHPEECHASATQNARRDGE